MIHEVNHSELWSMLANTGTMVVVDDHDNHDKETYLRIGDE